MSRPGETQGAGPWIDIHCHCLPGVDDGPNTLAGSIELCRQLVTCGVEQAIATPHQLGRYEGRNAAHAIRAATSSLQAELDREEIPLRLHAGAEVRIDPGVITLLQRDEILTLADGRRHLLLELPLDVMVSPLRLINDLAKRDVRTVVAHVERYPGVVRNPDLTATWLAEGAALQVNAGSLLGEAGAAVEACAWELLRRGSVSLIASDAHDATRRKPRLAEVALTLADAIGAGAARQLLYDNPLRVLQGHHPQPVISFVDV